VSAPDEDFLLTESSFAKQGHDDNMLVYVVQNRNVMTIIMCTKKYILLVLKTLFSEAVHPKTEVDLDRTHQ